jgi:hypothetical protein
MSPMEALAFTLRFEEYDLDSRVDSFSRKFYVSLKHRPNDGEIRLNARDLFLETWMLL